MNKKQQIILAVTFIPLLIGRLCIAGTGYLEDQDETLYIWIHKHFAGFSHLATWVKSLYNTQGQPPEVLIRLLQYITLLPVASAMGKRPLHYDVLYFVGLYNIIVSLAILYVFFRILLRLGFSFYLALAGMIVLGTLFNYNMYTRHILPYDHALLFQLLAFYLLLADGLKPRTVFAAGWLSAIGLTNYLGTFMFIFISGGYIILAEYREPRVAIRKALLFVLPFVILLGLYEIMARAEGTSYLAFVTRYYGTIGSEGSFDEGLSFIFIYFYMVEKWWGVILLVLFFWGSYLLFRKTDSDKIKRVVFLGIVGYLAFGVYVMLFKSMVFEGRVLHIYYPFIIIGVLIWVQYQKVRPVYHIAAAMVIIAAINYAFLIKDFNAIAYPRATIYKYHLFGDNPETKFIYQDELAYSIPYNDSFRRSYCIDTIGPGLLPPGQYRLCNIGFLPHYPDSVFSTYTPWMPKDRDSIIFEKLDFESYPAYTLEYCSRLGRHFFIEKQLKIRIVKEYHDASVISEK